MMAAVFCMFQMSFFFAYSQDPQDGSSLSSAYNTMSSTKSISSNLSGYSGADVEWTEGLDV